ncbi:Uncharacterised protein [Yersinia kristensenii]|nr:Uncharacterised protein [Yersinia kristensenii]
MLITDTGTNPILRVRSNNGQLVKVYTTIEKPTLGELGAVSIPELNTAIDNTKTYVSANYYNKTQADTITNELKLYSDSTYPTKVSVTSDIATLKTYSDSTFSTKVSVTSDIATLKTYSDTTFSTKTELSNGLNTKLNLNGGTLAGPLISKQSGALTFTPMDETAYNWIHWTQVDGSPGWRMGRMDHNGGFYLRDYSAGGIAALNLKQGEYILTTGNTTVDSNGFLKKASPVVKLYGDGQSETNEESEGAISERISEGVYKISGVLGFNSDDSWGGVDGGIEIPTDKNKQPLIWIDYELEENGNLIIKTYHRTHPTSPAFTQNTVGNYVDGQPIDIPNGRFIDLRVQMPEDPNHY